MDKKRVRIIYLINLLIDGQMFFIEPVFAIYLTTYLGFSVTLCSFVIGSNFVGSIIGCFAVPLLVKKFNYKTIMTGCMVIIGLSCYALITTESMLLLSLFNGALGVGYCTLTSNIQSIISKVVKDEKLINEAFAKRAVASNVGISVGVLVSGFLKNKGLIQWCFFIPALLSIVVISLIILFIKDMELEDEEYISIVQVLKKSFTNARLQVFNILSFCLWMTLSAFMLGLPLFVNHVFPKLNIGLVYFINTGTIVLLQVKFIKIVSEKMSTLKAIATGSMVITFAFVIFFATNSLPLLVMAVVVFSIGEVMVLPLIPSFISSESDNKDTDVNISFMMLVRYMGLAIGQIIAGSLIDYTIALDKPLRLSWLFFAVISLIVCVGLYIYSNYMKNKQQTNYKVIDN